MQRLHRDSINKAIRDYALPLIFFGVLALALTWPLAAHLTTDLPLGYERSATVPLLNVWTMWWNVDRLQHAYHGYWAAPIFHPSEKAFALGEPQPMTGIMALPLWPLGSPPLAYNLLLLTSLVLNGWFAMRLARTLRIAQPVAVVVGGLMVSLPLVHWSLGVVQLVPLWGLLWALDACLCLTRRPHRIDGVRLGLAITVTYGICCYHGLFFLVLLPWLLLPSLFRHGLKGRYWQSLAIAGIIALSGTFPVVLKQWQVLRGANTARRAESVLALSAGVADYAQTPFGWYPRSRHCRWPVSLGWLKWAAVVGGTVCGLARRKWRRATLAVLCMVIAAALLSSAPRVRFVSTSLYDLAVAFVPGFSSIRNIYRFAFFVQIGAVILIGFGMHWAWLQLRVAGLGKLIRLGAIALFAMVAMAETWPTPQVTWTAPRVPSAVANWLAGEAPEDSVLVVLPVASGRGSQKFESVGEAMYLQMWHSVPMVNGYNGYLDRAHLPIQRVLQHFPSPQSLQLIRDRGINLAMVRQGALTADQLADLGWQRVAVDEANQWELYRL